MILVSDVKRINMTEANCLFCTERCSQQPITAICYEPVESSQHVLNIYVVLAFQTIRLSLPGGPSFQVSRLQFCDHAPLPACFLLHVPLTPAQQYLKKSWNREVSLYFYVVHDVFSVSYLVNLGSRLGSGHLHRQYLPSYTETVLTRSNRGGGHE